MNKLPNIFNIKVAANLFIIAICIVGIYFAHQVIVPLILAFLIAVLLRPVVAFLNFKLKFPHVIAVFVTVILAIMVGAGIIFFISKEISTFAHDVPKIKQHLNMHFHDVQYWIYERFNISYHKQNNYLEKVSEDMRSENGLMGNTLDRFSTIVLTIILVPIYTFFILLYRTLFINFLTKMVHIQHHPILKEIVTEVKVVIRSYIVGLLLEMGIVATLVSAGLMIVGIDYAIFIGVIAGILNLVPYIGILTAASLSIAVTLGGSSELGDIFGVIIVFLVVHLLDSNVLIPRVVSSKVKINALAAIFGIVCGGTLIGIAGMFLALPVIAIIKVVFDRVPALSPLGYLLGDTIPKTFDWYSIKLPDLNMGNEHPDDTPNATEIEPPTENG
ncbi:MAG: AI-2E family transporter [Bacteroidia bacterium]